MSDSFAEKKKIKPLSKLEWLYLQYCLVTGVYMLEPWERKVFTSVAVSFISIAVGLSVLIGRALLIQSKMPDDKVTILLRAVGDAPILKQKKFNVDVHRTVAWFSQVIRKLINLPDDQCLHVYISQTFAPSPDHTFGSLRDCYAVKTEKDDHLIMHYSTTYAWG